MMISFKQEMKTFISNHKTLCYCTAGVGVGVVAVGKLGQRLTRRIKEKHDESTRKTSDAAEKTFEENQPELRELSNEEVKLIKQKNMNIRKKIKDASDVIKLDGNTLNAIMKKVISDISTFIPAIFDEEPLFRATSLKLSIEISINGKIYDLAFLINASSQTSTHPDDRELSEIEEPSTIDKEFFDKALTIAQNKVEETLKDVEFNALYIQWNIFLKSTDKLLTNRSGFGRYNDPLGQEDEFVHGQDQAVSVALINGTLIKSNILDDNLNFVMGQNVNLITRKQS